VLGFGLMAQLGPQAAFLSAGGYHHHLGANIWESRGAPPAPAGSATLALVTIVVPSEEERERVLARAAEAGAALEDGLLHDPSGNPLRLEAAQAR
jgi:catechol 2,3-dioxygenase